MSWLDDTTLEGCARCAAGAEFRWEMGREEAGFWLSLLRLNWREMAEKLRLCTDPVKPANRSEPW